VILSRAVAKKRTRQAKDIYAELGGGSPLLPNTEAQARALEAGHALLTPDEPADGDAGE
jgi:protoporphyrin/coproporphyrin ferrochelatase